MCKQKLCSISKSMKQQCFALIKNIVGKEWNKWQLQRLIMIVFKTFLLQQGDWEYYQCYLICKTRASCSIRWLKPQRWYTIDFSVTLLHSTTNTATSFQQRFYVGKVASLVALLSLVLAHTKQCNLLHELKYVKYCGHDAYISLA